MGAGEPLAFALAFSSLPRHSRGDFLGAQTAEGGREKRRRDRELKGRNKGKGEGREDGEERDGRRRTRRTTEREGVSGARRCAGCGWGALGGVRRWGPGAAYSPSWLRLLFSVVLAVEADLRPWSLLVTFVTWLLSP